MTTTDTYTITKADGKPYTVRKDRNRYFYPDEWKAFYQALKKPKRPLFDFLINTGARIDEATHIREKDFDIERATVRIWKVKVKAKKGEKTGKPRTIPLSSEFIERVKKYIKDNKNGEYLWGMSNQAPYGMLKRKLKGVVEDPYNFGLHNIRKTHGMWLKALNIPAEEICLRLGHDFNTYLKHYGSSDVFSNQDIAKIDKMMGDLYQRRRRY